MSDQEFLRKQRRTHLTITGIWFIVVGVPLIAIGYLEGSIGVMGMGASLVVIPPLFSTILNWNDTSCYS